MALTLDEIHDKEKNRLRKPTLIRKKTLMPWDSFSNSSTTTDSNNKKKPTLENEKETIDDTIDKNTLPLKNKKKRKSDVKSSDRSDVKSSDKLIPSIKTTKSSDRSDVKVATEAIKNHKPDSNNLIFHTPLSSHLPAKSDVKSSDRSDVKSSDKPIHSIKTTKSSDRSDVKSGDKVATQVATEVTSKVTSKVATKKVDKTPIKFCTSSPPKKDYSELSPLSQEVVLFIYKSCLEKASLSTGKIGIKTLISATKSSAKTIKKTIQRLSYDGIISKVEFKDGRGGWTRYSINTSIYQQIRQFNLAESDVKSSDRSDVKSGDKVATQVATTPFYSSSNNINIDNITTTTQPTIEEPQDTLFGLPQEWFDIDTEQLRSKGIHFGQNQIRQIYETKKLTAEEVQDSIYAFAHELEHNEKNNIQKQYGTTKVGYLLGILKKGRVYVPLDNYESPSDRAIRELDERVIAKSQKRKERLSRIKEGLFDEWVEEVDDETIKLIVPTYQGNRFQPIVKNSLKAHFDETVFPDIYNDIIKGVGEK